MRVLCFLLTISLVGISFQGLATSPEKVIIGRDCAAPLLFLMRHGCDNSPLCLPTNTAEFAKNNGFSLPPFSAEKGALGWNPLTFVKDLRPGDEFMMVYEGKWRRFYVSKWRHKSRPTAVHQRHARLPKTKSGRRAQARPPSSKLDNAKSEGLFFILQDVDTNQLVTIHADTLARSLLELPFYQIFVKKWSNLKLDGAEFIARKSDPTHSMDMERIFHTLGIRPSQKLTLEANAYVSLIAQGALKDGYRKIVPNMTTIKGALSHASLRRILRRLEEGDRILCFEKGDLGVFHHLEFVQQTRTLYYFKDLTTKKLVKGTYDDFYGVLDTHKDRSFYKWAHDVQD